MEIYYFSGTGNSLAVARDLAEKTQARLRAIPVESGQVIGNLVLLTPELL